MPQLQTYARIALALLTDYLPLSKDPLGSPVTNNMQIADLAGLIAPGIQGFRLTLETGVPVSVTDQLAKSVVYATPFLHNALPLWDGTRWVQFQVAEFSVTLAGLTSGKNYDVIAYIKAGVPALDLMPAWTNDTTRASAISQFSGVYTNTGTITSVINGDSLTGGKARVLGTLRTTGATTTADSGGLSGTTQVGATRFLWNMVNRVVRPMKVIDTTNNWTYTTGSYRQANAAAGNKIEYVVGLLEDALLVDAMGTVSWASGSPGYTIGIGLDSTTADSSQLNQAFFSTVAGALVPVFARYRAYPGLGYHAITWLEKGGTEVAIYGSGAGQSGLLAELAG